MGQIGRLKMAAMHILIVKHGALGDVVRTAYFARALKEKYAFMVRVSWLTSVAALPLLRFNPYIDDIWVSFGQASNYCYDIVYSLDDELDTLGEVTRLRARSVRGAFIGDDGNATYSADASKWFDMGLLSRFGKQHADYIKKFNSFGHAEIFAEIFGTSIPKPSFFGNCIMESAVFNEHSGSALHIGINAYAGGRWRAKELPSDELNPLVARLLDWGASERRDLKIILLGAGGDREKNEAVAKRWEPTVVAENTDDSVLRLAAVVKRLDYLITSDSLAMHLAIAQGRPCLAFFCPTSAVEIDDFGLCRKVVSTGADYCSYRGDADNSSIAAERVWKAFLVHSRDLW